MIGVERNQKFKPYVFILTTSWLVVNEFLKTLSYFLCIIPDHGHALACFCESGRSPRYPTPAGD
jgi:hypothetical protein